MPPKDLFVHSKHMNDTNKQGSKPRFLREDWLEKADERIHARKNKGKPGLCRPEILRKTLKTQSFARAFKVRTLNQRQRQAVMLLSDFTSNYTNSQIAHQLEVTTATLWRWRNDPLFISELDKEITKRKTSLRREAYRHLFNKIRTGNYQAMKDYFKMTGDLKQQVEMTHIQEQLPEDALDAEIDRLSKELGIDLATVEE